MNQDITKEQRFWLWAILISSTTGVGIWYYLRLSSSPVRGWLTETIEMFSYFTNLSNLIVIVMAASLLFGRGRLRQWFSSPAVQAACCLYVAFVGLGFWFLLGGPDQLVTVIDWLTEMTAHTLSPILGFVYWLRGVPKGQLTWRHPFMWLSYPIGYLVYWLFRGPIVGEYPYFFVDVNELGYGGVATWSGVLVVAFLILGGLMLLWDRRSST